MDTWVRIANGWRHLPTGTVTLPPAPGTPTATPRGEGSLPVGEANYPAPAGALWVSTTGNDANPGTEASPVRTLARAALIAPTNGTIVMRGGTYHEGGTYDPNVGPGSLAGIMFTNNGVTVQNAPGEAVWLDGSQVVTGWTNAGSGRWSVPFVTRRDRTQTNTRGQDDNSWPGGRGFVSDLYPYAHYSEQVFLDGVQLEQVGALADVAPGKFYVAGSTLGGPSVDKNLFTSTTYYIGDNPTGREVRISTISRAMTIQRTNITLRGIGIRRYNAALCEFGTIYYNSHGGTAGALMENVVIEDIAQVGTHNYGTNGIIRYCTVQRCGNIGYTPNADDMLIEHCLIRECNYGRYNYGPSAGGIKFHVGHRLQLQHNRFEDNYGHAFWADQSVYDAVIINNDFIDGYGHAIGWEISAKVAIINNLFVNTAIASDVRPPHDSCPVWASGSTEVDVWSNTFVNSEAHIRFGRDTRDPMEPGNNYGRDPRMPDSFYQTIMTWSSKGHRVCNNVFYRSPGFSSVQACFYSMSPDTPTPYFELVTGGNLFNRLTGTTPTRFANGARSISGSASVVTWPAPTSPDHLGGPTWASIVGETGSVFISGRDAMTSTTGGQYVVAPADKAAVTLQPMPATLAQRVGLPGGFTHLGAWR